jgi:hypothetical protein
MDDLIPKVFDRSITTGTMPWSSAIVITCEFIIWLGGGYIWRRSQHRRNADSPDHLESRHYVRPGGGFEDMSLQTARVPA